MKRKREGNDEMRAGEKDAGYECNERRSGARVLLRDKRWSFQEK
jgi:hypothetical protein